MMLQTGSHSEYYYSVLPSTCKAGAVPSLRLFQTEKYNTKQNKTKAWSTKKERNKQRSENSDSLSETWMI